MNRTVQFAPPPGRPGWSCPKAEQLELLYLAWGWRRYRETPQRITAREGWLYFTPRKGAPSLLLKGEEIVVRVGEIFIFHPDCECGFSDVEGATVEVCTWVWRTASSWASLHPAPGGYLRISMSKEDAFVVRSLHDQARREIQASDENTRFALKLLKQQLDLALVRSQSDRPHPATHAQRLELACRWIEQHLGDHNPVAGLCDYLQLSASTLNRIFNDRLGLNVRTYAKQARLRRARHLIDVEKRSVKEAAYTLGYRFPNDLSRAARATGGASSRRS